MQMLGTCTPIMIEQFKRILRTMDVNGDNQRLQWLIKTYPELMEVYKQFNGVK